MEATDDMYLDQMAEVPRRTRKSSRRWPTGPEKESLKVQIKKDIFTNIFFANEAYTSEGAITHVVAGSQAGLTTEQLAEKLKPTETVQSANEQLADLLKDMEHYEDEEHEAREHGGDPAAVAGQAFVHASKYLERLLDADSNTRRPVRAEKARRSAGAGIELVRGERERHQCHRQGDTEGKRPKRCKSESNRCS